LPPLTPPTDDTFEVTCSSVRSSADAFTLLAAITSYLNSTRALDNLTVTVGVTTIDVDVNGIEVNSTFGNTTHGEYIANAVNTSFGIRFGDSLETQAAENGRRELRWYTSPLPTTLSTSVRLVTPPGSLRQPSSLYNLTQIHTTLRVHLSVCLLPTDATCSDVRSRSTYEQSHVTQTTFLPQLDRAMSGIRQVTL
jgi:hypothetical protein